MIYKSSAIISHLPAKLDYIDAPIMRIYMKVISSKLDFVACPSSYFNSVNAE